MVYHRSVVLPFSSLGSYELPICLDILSFNQLTDKVRRNMRFPETGEIYC